MDGNPDLTGQQVGYLATNKEGEVGAYGINPGFTYAVHDEDGNSLFEAVSWL